MKNIFLILIFISLLDCFSQVPNPDEVPDFGFDVISYEATLDFSQTEEIDYINAQSKIKINWLDKTKTKFFFHLKDLEIDSVLDYNGNPLEFTIEEEGNRELECYSVDLGSEIPDEVNLTVFYQGELTHETDSRWGGVHNDDTGLYSIGVGFRNHYVSTTRHWLASFDHPSDKAKYDLTFIVPNTKKAASIGELVSFTENKESSSFNWVTEFDISSYLVSFLIDDFSETKFSDANLEYIIYHNEDEKEAVDFAFQNLPEMLRNFELAFDEEYPFEKVGFYLMRKPAAMEHQTLISINKSTVQRYFDNLDTNGSTISHELAHHWFGNMISPKDFRDAWLNESFASISEAIHLEYQWGGETHFWNKIRQDGEQFFSGISSSDGAIPIYGFDREESTNYPGTIYRKGSVALAQLRHKIGDDAFFDALRNYIDEYKFANASTQDLKNNFEQSYGMSLDSFFDDWIYGFGWPVLTYQLYTDGDNSTLRFDQLSATKWTEYSELHIPIKWEDESGFERDSIFIITPDNSTVNIGRNVDYNSIKLNESDNFYLPALFIISTNVLQEANNEIQYDKSSNIITLNDVFFSCPNVKMVNLNGRIASNTECVKKIVTNSLDRGLYFVFIEDGNKEYFAKILID
jgi:aminopeptidase N